MRFTTSIFTSFLAFLVNNNLTMGAGNQYINYGDITYLQIYGTTRAWLNVETRYSEVDISDIAYEGYSHDSGQFILVHQGAFGNPNADPKKGTCLKFGDQFGMYSNAIRESIQWVAVRVNDWASELIITNDDASISHMTFTIRSTQGNGELSQESNSDPLFGECVQQNSVAFLQSTMQDGQWLGMTAGRDAQTGNVGASLISIFTDPIEYPQWIISTTLSDGSNSQALACQTIPNATKGRWVAINGVNNGNQQKVSFTVGTTKANSQEVTTTDAWKKSITDTVSGGFQFLGTSTSVKVPVTGVFSGSQQSSINEVLMLCESQTIEADFNQGQVWQFVLDTADVCDVTGFSINVEKLTLTKGKNDYPCCLPGYFVDDSNPHGPCVSVDGIASPCVCSDDICNGTPPSRGLRGSMN